MNPLDRLAAHCREIRITPETSFGIPAVYLLIQGDRVIYIGSTANIEQRIGQHIDQAARRDPITPRKLFDRVLYLPLPTKVHGHYEGALTRAFRPALNGATPSDKGHDAEILEGLGLAHLIPELRPFGRPRLRLVRSRKRGT